MSEILFSFWFIYADGRGANQQPFGAKMKWKSMEEHTFGET